MALTYHHVTSAGAGNKTGSSWSNAMGEAEFETDIEGTVTGNDVYFIKGGTYTLDSAYDSSARDGTIIAPISFIGVKSTTTNEGSAVVFSDWATGGDRPFFDCVTYAVTLGDFYITRNIYFQGSSTTGVRFGISCIVENCKFDNDYGSSSSRYACYSGNVGCLIINCEILSTNCKGVYIAGDNKIMNCYIHDCSDATNGIGMTTAGGSIVCIFNIFDNCTVGISSASRDNFAILNNTYYECGTAISETDGNGWCVINNIVEGSNTAGFLWTTQTDSNFFWDNHGDDARNTDMWSLVDVATIFQDYVVTTGDPLFETAGSDFSLEAGSPCLNTGSGITLGT